MPVTREDNPGSWEKLNIKIFELFMHVKHIAIGTQAATSQLSRFHQKTTTQCMKANE